MKILRPILWCVAVVAALLVLVLGLAFNASVQTWAARRALVGQPGLKSELGRVSAGMKRTELTNIAISKPGFDLKLPSLTIDMPLMSAANKKIEVKKLVARGWTIDLSVPEASQQKPATTSPSTQTPAQSSAPAEAQPFAFEGGLKLLSLPVDFSLEEIDVAGDVTFATQPGRPKAHASVVFSGGKLGVGSDGVFKYASKITLPDPDAPVREMTVDSLITVRMATPRTLQKVSIVTDVRALGPKFPNGASLHAEIVLNSNAAGENYLVIAQTPLADAWKNLFSLEASYPAGATTLAGKWKIDVANTDLAPFTLGLLLPVFGVVGEGYFEADRTFAMIHAAGRLDNTVEQLSVFRPELSAIGKIRTQIDFDLAKKGDLLRVDRLSAAISGAKPIVSVQALQKFDYDVGARALKVADPAAELLRLTLHGLPLAWVQPYVKDLALTGDDVRGEFFASARNGGFAIRPSAPITLNNLNLSRAGKPLVRALDVAVKLAADSTQQGWQADFSEIVLRSGAATLLNASLKAGQPAGATQLISATGNVEANLPALLAQPAAAPYAGLLSQGALKADFSAKVGPTQQLSATVVIADLVSPKAEKLPQLQAGLRLDLQSGGRIEARLPLVLDAAGRKSDIELAARIKTLPAVEIEADVVSNAIFVEDLRPLQALAASLESEPKPASTAKTNGKSAKAEPVSVANPNHVADKLPFWNGCTGQLNLALKEVVYSPDLKTSVTGLLKIEAGAIKLESIKAVLVPGGEATINGRMTFNATAAEPYAFEGDAKVNSFDPAPFFRVANPQKEPTVEGKFDIEGHLSGVAPNAALLTKKLKADLNLTSRTGVFRGLALPKAFSDRFQGKSGNLLSSVTGAVVALAGGQKNGATAAAAVEIAGLLVAIPYDQLNVRATHEATAARTTLDDFTLISPTMRLTGTGSILQQEGVPLLKQPLTIQLELGSRGYVADAFGKQGMLQAGSDSLGYTPLFAPIRLDGTLSEVGTEALMNLLVQKLLANAASPLGNLFGK
ncbi:MAG: AsmA-like C-terminal region-containing protein [Nibricoccus sp.]